MTGEDYALGSHHSPVKHTAGSVLHSAGRTCRFYRTGKRDATGIIYFSGAHARSAPPIDDGPHVPEFGHSRTVGRRECLPGDVI